MINNIDFDRCNDREDIEIQIDDLKDFAFYEEYYPVIVSKTTSEIFEDIIKYNLIFKCNICDRYFDTYSKCGDNSCENCEEERLI